MTFTTKKKYRVNFMMSRLGKISIWFEGLNQIELYFRWSDSGQVHMDLLFTNTIRQMRAAKEGGWSRVIERLWGRHYPSVCPPAHISMTRVYKITVLLLMVFVNNNSINYIQRPSTELLSIGRQITGRFW